MHSHFPFPPFRKRSRSSVWFTYNACFHRVRVAAWNFAGTGKSLKSCLWRIHLHSVNKVIGERLVHLEKPRMSTIPTCQLCHCTSVMTWKSPITLTSECLSFHGASGVWLRSPLHTLVQSALSASLLMQCRSSCSRNSRSDISHICVPARLAPVSMPATGSALLLSSVSLTWVAVKLSSFLRAAELFGPSRQELPPSAVEHEKMFSGIYLLAECVCVCSAEGRGSLPFPSSCLLWLQICCQFSFSL